MIPPLPTFGQFGFGAMHLSGRSAPDRETAISVVHAALDAGARLIDTADAYCRDASDTGHNESLVAEAVRSWDGPVEAVLIATKGGHVRDDEGRWLVNGRADHLRRAAMASRHRLGVPAIDLYQFHRPDPSVPWSESILALAALVKDGIVRHVGLSNVNVEQIERARDVIEVASVQNELSPFDLSSMPVVEWCDRAATPFLAYSPLGGAGRAAGLAEQRSLRPFADVAAAHHVSVQQVVLAWLASLSPLVTVIPGTRRIESVRDSMAAAELRLTADELSSLDAAVEVSTTGFVRPSSAGSP